MTSATSDMTDTSDSEVFVNPHVHHHSTPMSSVHGNLMRSRQKQDPMKYVLRNSLDD